MGKLQRVFAPHYLTLRAQWPQAFAIKPTRGGYEAVVFIEGATNVRNPERAQDAKGASQGWKRTASGEDRI
ncbi:hypothetical protein PM395_gp47 [Xanthomonas phage Samson]|uniref:Uncharacterized protein n=1 Tax=Xanthomonas phage Samson TaxID=2596676 RepID=A0A5B9N6Z5_9CAUD|nr:hypothetical protein PM395_gp47 [Xanthomonas phage Samson]QEG09359.1 hypothetical protein Samson_044 [Xanthomonas phage Samson]